MEETNRAEPRWLASDLGIGLGQMARALRPLSVGVVLALLPDREAPAVESSGRQP